MTLEIALLCCHPSSKMLQLTIGTWIPTNPDTKYNTNSLAGSMMLISWKHPPHLTILL
jgi:hypothetical protein